MKYQSHQKLIHPACIICFPLWPYLWLLFDPPSTKNETMYAKHTKPTTKQTLCFMFILFCLLGPCGGWGGWWGCWGWRLLWGELFFLQQHLQQKMRMRITIIIMKIKKRSILNLSSIEMYPEVSSSKLHLKYIKNNTYWLRYMLYPDCLQAHW